MINFAAVDKAGLAANSLREQPYGLSDMDHLHCDYCGKSRHAKEQCWKLHDCPTKGHEGNRMGSARSQANVSEAVSVFEDTAIIGMFFNEELQTLRRFLSQFESQSTTVAFSNFVNSGVDNRENDWQW
ncbi:hypothetical protein P3X46_028321 [Hevea brasiliensis]|uniref:CCHC-type domain-containing protein n=1 Tax=Hevea brasiliensis TaxID=3981 RepID=A0ABQ9KQJ1_HEVBR|nr:hypothetical protein P3X46_028321 [Hevea brasiliensis]